MLITILNWASGGLLDKALAFFAGRDQARLDAMNSEQQRAHEARMSTAADARAVRLATAGFWEMRVLATAIVLPYVVQLYLVAWDTLWPQPWSVEKFPPPFDEMGSTILMSFFGLAGARLLAGAVAMRYK